MSYLNKTANKAVQTFQPSYRITIFLLTLLCLASCGGGGGSSSSSSSDSNLTVTASLGQIRNAAVSLLDSNLMPIGDPVEIDINGIAVFDRPSGSGPFMVVIDGDADAEYFDESTGIYLPFPAGQQLRAIVGSAQSQVAVTLFTELAVVKVENEIGGLASATPASVNAANDYIRDAFLEGLEDITLPPIVVGSASDSLGDNLEDIYAAMLAAFAELAAIQASPALAILEQLREDLRDGVFDSQLNGMPLMSQVVDLSDLAARLDAVFPTVVSEFGGSTLTVSDMQAVRDGLLSGQWTTSFRGSVTIDNDVERIPLEVLSDSIPASEVPSVRSPNRSSLEDELIEGFVFGFSAGLPGSTLQSFNFSIRSETLEKVTIDFSGTINIPAQNLDGVPIPNTNVGFVLQIFFDRVSN